MTGFFLTIYDFFKKRKLLLMLLMFAWFAFTGYFASKINLREDISDMLPSDPESTRMTDFFKNSRLSDRIIVTLSSENEEITPEILIGSAEAFSDKLHKEYGRFVDSVDIKKDAKLQPALMDLISRNLPLFLDENDYIRLDSLLHPDAIQAQIGSNYKALIGPAGFALKETVISDPLGISVSAFRKLEQFGSDENMVLYDGYYFSQDLKTIMIMIDPALTSGQTDENAGFFKGIESIFGDRSVVADNITPRYFGAPAVAAGNSAQIRKDTTLTLTLTVILLLVLFIGFFRNLLSPLIILIPVASGALFALSAIYLIKGDLSVISLGAGSLVLGIAVNYSLHFMTHLKFHPDPRSAIKSLAFPMTAGSLTTISGFLCLQFVNAPVLRDLGLYAALSLIGAAIATLIFLPHFHKRKATENQKIQLSEQSLSRLIGKVTGSKAVLYVILILTPVLFWFARDVRFETDMNAVNYMSDQLRESEQFIGKFTNRYQKSIFMVSEADNLEQALQQSEAILPVQQKLLEENKISGFTNLSTLLPSVAEQERRIKNWQRFWSEKDTASIRRMMIDTGAEFKFKSSVYDHFSQQINQSYQPLSNDDSEFLKKEMLAHLIDSDSTGYRVTGFIRTTNEQSTQVYAATSGIPGVSVFDRKMITDKLVELVGDDFNFITLWTSLIVFFALLIIYGRIELAVISFLPMVFAWIWILGIMSVFGISFNIINIVLSTLIFALGDDFCIFTADSLQQSYATGTEATGTTTVSITLSALATISGMGVLIFAGHPALSSIATVSVVGIIGVWFMSQVLQPVLFRFMISNPASNGHQPYTAWGIIKSVFAFSYFTIGSLIITLIGIIMLKIIPGKSEKRKLFYHQIMQLFTKSLVYIMCNVKKQIINPAKEDFSKPAVIIANHSSVLDILLTVMQHPKVLLVTNKWVWNSPVFGAAIRMAEYYPVAEGADNTIPQLEDKVRQGYSVVVFPEGTRSVTGKIGRFHKGAFFMAEKLNLDILPLMIHGAGHTLKKGFFYLNDGQLTLKFLPRYRADQLAELGNGYREMAKTVSAQFKKEFDQFSGETGNVDYFRKQLIANYLYKGPVLEWYLKVKIRLEDNYRLFESMIPKAGRIYDLGCGYGFLSYMLALTSRHRLVTGVDYDQDKIAVAQSGYLRPDHLNFESGDITEFTCRDADVIVVNDVLHYLLPEQQIRVIEQNISALNPGGMLIIRDGIKELSDRHQGTKLTELFSTKILGFNKRSEHGLHFISSKMIHDLSSKHGMKTEVIDNTKLTSNVVFILRKA